MFRMKGVMTIGTLALLILMGSITSLWADPNATVTMCGKVVGLQMTPNNFNHYATIAPVGGGPNQIFCLYGNTEGAEQSMLLGIAYLNKEFVKMSYDPNYLTACGSNSISAPANYGVQLTNSMDPSACN